MRRLTRFLILGAVTALAACAAQAPATSTAGGGTASSAATGTSGHAVPDGYHREVINGEERYCSNDTSTGSRVARTKVCLTWEELEAQERSHAEITRGFGPVN